MQPNNLFFLCFFGKSIEKINDCFFFSPKESCPTICMENLATGRQPCHKSAQLHKARERALMAAITQPMDERIVRAVCVLLRRRPSSFASSWTRLSRIIDGTEEIKGGIPLRRDARARVCVYEWARVLRALSRTEPREWKYGAHPFTRFITTIIMILCAAVACTHRVCRWCL